MPKESGSPIVRAPEPAFTSNPSHVRDSSPQTYDFISVSESSASLMALMVASVPEVTILLRPLNGHIQIFLDINFGS